MASSVHDHFGTYHFGTGFLTTLKSGPLQYIVHTISVHPYTGTAQAS